MHCLLLLLCEFLVDVLSPLNQTLILIMLLWRQRAAEIQKQHNNFAFNTCKTCFLWPACWNFLLWVMRDYFSDCLCPKQAFLRMGNGTGYIFIAKQRRRHFSKICAICWREIGLYVLKGFPPPGHIIGNNLLTSKHYWCLVPRATILMSTNVQVILLFLQFSQAWNHVPSSPQSCQFVFSLGRSVLIIPVFAYVKIIFSF